MLMLLIEIFMVKKQDSQNAGKYFDIKPVLGDVISYAIENNTHGSLLHICIDNMSMVISGHDKEYADKMVINLIAEIEKILDKDAIVKRSAREYIDVILPNCNEEDIKPTAHKIHEIIRSYGSKIAVEPIQLISTIGGVDFPVTAKTADSAMSLSYIALNDAKDLKKRFVHYKNMEGHEIASKNQMILATYLQNALQNNKLRLAFQPIISAQTGDIAFYECLLRIINDDGTVSSAGPFIPIAEKMGFIDTIDTAVLKMVAQELKKNKDVILSMNVSNDSIHSNEWVSATNELLQDRSIAVRLIVEVIETTEQQDTKKLAIFLASLREKGCRIALDDFGSGYTSFSQLKNLPIDIIKIDGIFVRDITENDENKFFVKTLLEFSHNFGLKTVAEFVESPEIADMLNEMGVDYMQGNYFSPAVNYRTWIEK